MPRPLVRAAIQVWLLAFVVLAGTSLTDLVPGAWLVVAVLYGLPVVIVGLVRLRGPVDRLDWLVLVALAAYAIASLLSVDPTGSLASLGLALVYAVVFMLARRWFATDATRHLVALPFALGFTAWLAWVAIAWIGEKVGWIGAGGGIPPLDAVQPFLWGSPNTYPILVLLAWPFAASLPNPVLRRSLLAVIAVTAIAVVPMSVGRAGWLGLAIAVVSFWVLSGGSAERVRSALRAPAAWLAGLVALAAVVVLAGGRFVSAVALALDARISLWSQALGVFGADPITGSGPTTYSWTRLAHVPDYADPIGVHVAHNVVVQVLADGGLVLAGAVAAMALAWMAAVWRGRAVMTPIQRMGAAAVIGVAAASLLDDFTSLPAIVAGALLLAGWSVPVVEVAATTHGVRRWTLPVSVGLALLVVAWPMYAMSSARLAAGDGRAFAMERRWAQAADRFADAVAMHDTFPLHHLGHGLSDAESGDLESARAAYARAQALSPGDPRASGALAALSDDPDLAIDALGRATRQSTDAQYALRLSDALLGAGDVAGAADAYALAVFLRTDLYASLLQGRYGLGAADVRAALPAVASRVRAVDPSRAQVVAWDLDLADRELASDAPAAWRAVAAAAEGRPDEARALVNEARSDAPHDQMTHLAAAAVARFDCDEDAYRRAMRLAGRVLGGPVPTLAIGRDPIYRDFGLGDYQPSWVDRPPPMPVWPFGLVSSPSCPWAP